MGTVTKPRQALGRWLKAVPTSDVTHCILRYEGDLLVAYCGAIIPSAEAVPPLMGARHCVDCEARHRRRIQDQEKRKSHAAPSR